MNDNGEEQQVETSDFLNMMDIPDIKTEVDLVDYMETEETVESGQVEVKEQPVNERDIPSARAQAIYQAREEAHHKNKIQHHKHNNSLLNNLRPWSEANAQRFLQIKQEIGNTLQTKAKLREQKRIGAESFGFEVIQPAQRKRYRNNTKEFTFTEEELEQISVKDDILVPIRIDAEVEGLKIRDAFTWNMNDHLISPELFCEVLCLDLKIPPNLIPAFVPAMGKSIREQIEDFFQHSPSHLSPGAKFDGQDIDTKGLIVDNVDVDNGKRDAPELRFMIKLDITIDGINLIDNVEWDLNCKRNSPETFAEKLSSDLKLPREFITAIAHSVREQIYMFAKSLLLIDHKFDGAPITEDEELSLSFLPPIDSVTYKRDDKARGIAGPSILEVTGAEVDKLERDLDRETRRKRRTQRLRRAITLPDREPLKTTRTHLPGFHEAVADPTIEKQEVASDDDSDDGFSSGGGGGGKYGRTKGSQPIPRYPPVERIAPPATPTIILPDNNVNIKKGKKEIPLLAACTHCGTLANATPYMRDGPSGPGTLCNSCGTEYIKTKSLPTIQSYLKPTWIEPELTRLKNANPSDRYEPVQKNGEWRIRCLDCPGKLYGVGVGLTLENFEMKHVNSKGHRDSVSSRSMQE